MKVIKIFGGLVIVALTCEPALAQAQAVTVVGCPEPGVEAACLILRDAAGKLYDISAARPSPDRQKGEISLTGTPSDKITFCMQGSVVDHIEWTYTGHSCTAPTKKD